MNRFYWIEMGIVLCAFACLIIGANLMFNQ
jgi:hypothetical protein